MMSVVSKKYVKNPNVHEDCYIEIHPCYGDVGQNDGYSVFIIDSDSEDVILDDWEPDFEWAFETARFFSKQYNLEIVDSSPY